MQTEQIHPEKITYTNVQEVIRLSVSEAQKDFAATNRESLIEAYWSLADGKPVYPFAVYRAAGGLLRDFLRAEKRNGKGILPLLRF